jgi:predicted AlkP superfamily phosphohydrolase/phosphomutase
MLIPSDIYTIKSNSNRTLTRNEIRIYILKNIEKYFQDLDMSIEADSYENINNMDIDLYKSKLGFQNYDSLKIDINDCGNIRIVKKNEWSQWITIKIDSEYGLLPSLFRVKLLEVESIGKAIKIQRSGIYNMKGWSCPESFGEKLIKNVFEYDLPKKRKVEFMIYGKMKHYLKYARNESLSLVQAIEFAKKDMNWDFCFFHYHPLDTINHDLLAYLYKTSRVYTEKKAIKALKNVEVAYQIVDEMVGELISRCVDRDTIILFISDHGAIPIWKVANIPKILSQAGLLVYNFNQSKKKYQIDWNKTKAFPYMEPPFIWVNLKGREPHGIVEKNNYDNVREQIIKVLHNAKDPETGNKIIDNVLKREDASHFGLNSDRVGDIVYFLKPPYGVFDGILDALDASVLSPTEYDKPLTYDSKRFFGAHAYYTPDTKFGDFSITAPLIISGKEIAKGEKLNEVINLTDIAPTLSYLLKIPKPKQATGSIIYDVLE